MNSNVAVEELEARVRKLERSIRRQEKRLGNLEKPKRLAPPILVPM
jgi:chaperonin cofactor prefoldin